MLALRSRLLLQAGFRHGFSLRTGGVSQAPFDALNLARNVGDDPEAVRENHRLFAQELGYAAEALYEVSQVHGAEVELVDPAIEPLSFRKREADALVCGRVDVAIGVRVADCVPLLLACPRTKVVAAIHAGWRGVVANVIDAGISALCAQKGSEPKELLAAFGPHIGPASFEVGEDVADTIAGAVDDRSVIVRGYDKPHVDLARAVTAQLMRAGVAPRNIDHVEGDTFAEPTRFFSFRRDGSRSGRHLAVIVAGC